VFLLRVAFGGILQQKLTKYSLDAQSFCTCKDRILALFFFVAWLVLIRAKPFFFSKVVPGKDYKDLDLIGALTGLLATVVGAR
jgi:hypothetical protein